MGMSVWPLWKQANTQFPCVPNLARSETSGLELVVNPGESTVLPTAATLNENVLMSCHLGMAD